MFRKKEKSIGSLIAEYLRETGLETPLLEYRLVNAWPKVAGEMVARYTTDVQIRNQVLYVKLSLPILRAELSMRKSHYVRELNRHVGSNIITDIKFC